MTIAMDELDVAFLAPAGAPIWQPIGGDEATGQAASSTADADDGWAEIARQIELDRIWAAVAALFE
ncbi:MAG TPA: hypothetical protein VH482_02700 [Thermomicrobiales bacterium]|jgi:hypothetical protein